MPAVIHVLLRTARTDKADRAKMPILHTSRFKVKYRRKNERMKANKDKARATYTLQREREEGRRTEAQAS